VIRGEDTVVFVDLAGFTALTVAHGDEHAAEEAVALGDAVKASLPAGGRLVKTLGDGALVLLLAPIDALAFLIRLSAELESCGSLELRAGLHCGPVVERGGDVFGGTVNISARLAALASAHQVLASKPIADVAKGAGHRITSLGPMTLRNLGEPLEVFDIGLLPPRAAAEFIDPVCRMAISEDCVVGELRYAEHLYRFCSLDCAQRFAAHPDRFISGGRAEP
jgi:adenylate cyclase